MPITCLQVCASGVAVSGSWDSSLRVWECRSGVCRHILEAHKEGVYCFQFDRDKIISGGGDCSVKLWNMLTGERTMTLKGHSQEVLCVQYSDQLIASSSSDSSIRIWNYMGACVHVLGEHIGLVRCLHLSGHRLVSAGDRKKVNI